MFTSDWRFVDGTVCGKLRPPSASEYASLDAAGVQRGLDIRYADRGTESPPSSRP